MMREKRLLFLISFLFSSLCSSQSILNVEELSVQYRTIITNKPVLFNSEPLHENSLVLSSKHGQPYSCIFPEIKPFEDNELKNTTNAEDVAKIIDKSLNGRCLTHKKGWWTYKLCHKKSITQYHVGEAGAVEGTTTTLGVYDSEDDWTKEEILKRKPSEIYHGHQYLNGTVCDVTLQQRKAAVQYFCASKQTDDIIRVEEPATCEYLITVHSSKLCDHSLFYKKEKKQQIDLVCSPALNEQDYDKYTEKMKTKVANKAADKVEKKREKIYSDDINSMEKSDNEKSKIKGKPPLSKEKEKQLIEDKIKNLATFMTDFVKALDLKPEDSKIDKAELKVNEITEKEEDVSIERKDEKTQPDKSDKDLETDLKEKHLKLESSDEDFSNYNEDFQEESIDDELGDDVNDYLKLGKMVKTLNKGPDPIAMIKRIDSENKQLMEKATKDKEYVLKELDKLQNSAEIELTTSQTLQRNLEHLLTSASDETKKKELRSQLKYVKGLLKEIPSQMQIIAEKKKRCVRLLQRK